MTGMILLVRLLVRSIVVVHRQSKKDGRSEALTDKALTNRLERMRAVSIFL